MIKILIHLLIAVFAAYGFALFVFRTVIPGFHTVCGEIHPPYTVISVKNQADSIEAILRSTVWQMLSQSHSRNVCDIVVIDTGSTDETAAILHSLSCEYEFIHPMTKQQYIELIDSL